MKNKIQKWIADRVIELDYDGDYVFVTTLRIGVVEDDDGNLQIIKSFRENKGKYIGETSTGIKLDVEYMDIYTLK